MTNEDWAKLVDTSDEWITTRTGMKERRFAGEDECTSDMGAEAARRAMQMAGIEPGDIDLILCATITPDRPWPNTACMIQKKIDAWNAGCVGMEAACTGFVYAVETARNYIMTGSVDTVLVVSAEKMSCLLDWNDRATSVLFGDGAGAAVLQAKGHPRGIMGAVLGADGSLSDLLMQPAGGSLMPASEETVQQGLHYVKMAGRETFKHAVTRMADSAAKVVEQNGLTKDDITWLIPHQANMRIITAVAQRLKIPLERFIVNIEKYGNTSSATIPLALDEAVRDGRIKKGDVVLLVAFGGGLTWGAMVLEWDA
jgi:3-oxoacyl-[acyl-carrier-protein] synthase-3